MDPTSRVLKIYGLQGDSINGYVSGGYAKLVDPDINALFQLIPAAEWNAVALAQKISSDAQMVAGFSGAIVFGMVPKEFAAVQRALRSITATATLPLTEMYYAPLTMSRTVARRFTFATSQADVAAMMKIVDDLGFSGQLAQAAGKSVHIAGNYQYNENASEVYQSILDGCQKAVTDARAECIVLAGANGMMDPSLAPMLRSGLADYKDGVPQIIDPLGASVTMLQSLIRNKVWSNRSYQAVV